MLAEKPSLLESGFVQFLMQNMASTSDSPDLRRRQRLTQRAVYVLLETLPNDVLNVVVSVSASMFQGVLLYVVFTLTALGLGPSVSAALQTAFFLVVIAGGLGIAYLSLRDDGASVMSVVGGHNDGSGVTVGSGHGAGAVGHATSARESILRGSSAPAAHPLSAMPSSGVSSSSLSVWSGVSPSMESRSAMNRVAMQEDNHITSNDRNSDRENDEADGAPGREVVIDILDGRHRDTNVLSSSQSSTSSSFQSLSSESIIQQTSSHSVRQHGQRGPLRSQSSESASLASSFSSYSDSPSDS